MHIALSLVALGADLISAFALLFQACFREEEPSALPIEVEA